MFVFLCVNVVTKKQSNIKKLSYLLPEDGDRVQSQKSRFKIKTGRWLMSKKSTVLCYMSLHRCVFYYY
jgi:hypothetical protein